MTGLVDHRLGFAPISGEDFGRIATLGQFFRHGDQHLGADGDAAAVKPILNVLASRGPFKVISTRVGLVLVNMVNSLKSKRVWDKSFGNKTMNQQGLDVFPLDQLDFGVAVGAASVNSQAGSGISRFESSVNVPTDTFDASHVADFVKPFIILDRLPFFTRKINDFVALWRDTKNLFQGHLNVKFVMPVPFSRAAEINNFVPLVHGWFQNFLRNLAAKITAFSVVYFAGKTFDSAFIGKFIKAFVTGKRYPSFFVIHRSKSLVCPSFTKEQDLQGLDRCNPATGQEVLFASLNKGFLLCP